MTFQNLEQCKYSAALSSAARLTYSRAEARESSARSISSPMERKLSHGFLHRLEVANRSHGSKSFPNSYPPATTILTLHFLTRKKKSIIHENQ
jgi:hypothetical protein